MAVVDIAVLGPLEVRGDAAGLSPRDRTVLAALAVETGRVVSVERLADALWGGSPPASWNKVVPGCVMRLRRLLGVDAIQTVGSGYRLTLAPDEVDFLRFERLVHRGRELLELREAERAQYTFDQALQLWRGAPLSDLAEWEPGRIEANRLDELRQDAQECRLDAALRAGRSGEVIPDAQRGVAQAPLRERRWALLARAQYQCGQQGEALRTLQRARTVLVSELGLDPGPELTSLEQAILQHDPSLVVEATAAVAAWACPWPGLAAYGIDDADAFFGRDSEITACLDRLATSGSLLITGPSGSGKSSLARAGVAAGLAGGGRPVVLTPGADPVAALAADTPRAGQLLVVDQAEELFTLTRDATARDEFLEQLIRHSARGPLLIVLRADHLGDLAGYPRFARVAEREIYLLGPLTELLSSALGPETLLRGATEGVSGLAWAALGGRLGPGRDPLHLVLVGRLTVEAVDAIHDRVARAVAPHAAGRRVEVAYFPAAQWDARRQAANPFVAHLLAGPLLVLTDDGGPAED